MSPIDLIFAQMIAVGARRYGDEAVSQLAHALQCAMLAERAGAPAALVAAALLHDYGHIVGEADEDAVRRNIDAEHERSGADALKPWFGDAVTEPVRLHVDAKRYLCTTEPDYRARLSPASVRSLALQGGPFSSAEAVAFIAQPFAEDAVTLRRWDEAAKDPAAETPGLEHYRACLNAALRPATAVR